MQKNYSAQKQLKILEKELHFLKTGYLGTSQFIKSHLDKKIKEKEIEIENFKFWHKI